MGVVKLHDLRFHPLKSKEMEKLALEVSKGFHTVTNDITRKKGAKATSLFIPFLILGIRNAADNVFARQYKWLGKESERYLDKSMRLVFDPDHVWGLVHDEITRLFDPKLYHSYIAPFGNIINASKKLKEYKKREDDGNGETNNNTEKDAADLSEDAEKLEELKNKYKYNAHERKSLESKSKSINKGKISYYETSPALQSIVRDPSSAAARNMLMDPFREDRIRIKQQEKRKKELDAIIAGGPTNKLDSTSFISETSTHKFSVHGSDNIPENSAPAKPYTLAPSSRAALLQTIVQTNSKRYMSSYAKSRNREHAERAELLKESVEDREEMLRKRLIRKKKDFAAQEERHAQRWEG